MKTIFKYPLEIQDHIEIELPEGAQILDVQGQNGKAQLWALVDDAMPKEKRKFQLFGTGEPIAGPVGTFVKTFQMQGGFLVCHLFEIKQP